MKLGIKHKIKTVRNTHIWRVNNTFLNNQQVTEEIKREIKKILETNDNESTTTENLWDAAKAVLRGKFIAIVLPQETRKTSDRQPSFTPKQLTKEQKKPPRKEIVEITAEINEKAMKEIIVKISKTKSWFFEKIKLTNL